MNLFILCCPQDSTWDAINALATAATFIVTIFLYVLGKDQLDKLNSTSQSDFYHRIKTDYFKDKTREIFMVADCQALTFVKATSGTNYYFQVDETKVKAIFPFIPKLPAYYSEYDINDYTLNHIEDVALFLEKGNLPFSDIEYGYGYFIKKIIGNEAIQEYIATVNSVSSFKELQQNKPYYYSGSLDLYWRLTK
jgi:hypothetical protein